MSSASVWDTINALKAKNSLADTAREREKESARLRRAGVAVVEARFHAAAARGESDGGAIVAALFEDTPAAVQDVLDDQAKVLGDEGRAVKEVDEIVKLQNKAVHDLERARGVLCKVADDREVCHSRAGRLEYKVRM